MDFVVSKVVMAICALIVVSTLAGIFSERALLDGGRGFESVLSEFCEMAERAVSAGTESRLVWTAPYLPDGNEVTISIHDGIVLIESSEGSAAERPSQGIHIWHHDGRPLNSSTVDVLDRSAGSLEFHSGQDVEIMTSLVTYEEEPRLFVFADLAR